MNNLLDFNEFINEWKEIKVTKNDDGSIDINGDKLSDDIIISVKDLLSDDRDMIQNISGGYEGSNFLNNIKDNLDDIKNLKNSINISFPITNESKFIKLLENSEIKTIFNITPDNYRSIGKGEVLLAVYYNDVNRVLFHSKNKGESGDCYIFDENNNKTHYIEVKSGGSGFRKLSTYEHMEGYKKTIDLIKSECGVSKFEKVKKSNDIKIKDQHVLNDFIGGLACYCFKERKRKKLPLILVIFNNKYNGRTKADKNVSGFLEIPIGDTFLDTYKNMKNLFNFKNIGSEVKGGYGSRDFTISLNDENEIVVYEKNKKESEE